MQTVRTDGEVQHMPAIEAETRQARALGNVMGVARLLIGWEFLWQWLVLSLVGGMGAPVLFTLLDRLNRAVNYRPASESCFRTDREIKRGR